MLACQRLPSNQQEKPSMTRRFVVLFSFLFGILAGAGGLYLLRSEPALAQGNPTARFVPSVMVASEGDKGSVAWFLATDGRVKACVHSQGTPNPTVTCLPVNFGP
jgi:hypothetical protein